MPLKSFVMKNLLKIYAFAFFFLYDFVAFAQPNDEDNNGDLEGNDVPINSKLVVLLLLGLVFAFYSFKKNRKPITQ